MRSLVLLIAFGGMALAGSDPIREINSDFPSDGMAFFRGGRLFELSSMVRAYAPDGTRDFDEPILTPDGTIAGVVDIAAADGDGGFAVAVHWSRSQSCPLPGGIALLNSRGIQYGFIPTGCFLPQNIAVTEDHSIWVFGWMGPTVRRKKSEISAGAKTREQTDYDVLRKYSRDGTLEGSWVPRSTFPPNRKPRLVHEPTQLIASGNEVVLRAWGDLIHLDSDGNTLGRMRLDDLPFVDFRDFTITSDGRIYGCGEKGGFQSSLVVFNPEASGWRKVTSPAECLFGLIGSEKATLVFRNGWPNKMLTLDWFEQPTN